MRAQLFAWRFSDSSVCCISTCLQLSTVLPISMARSSWYLQDFRILSNAETRNKLKVYRAVCVSSGREVHPMPGSLILHAT